jgi:hypothetical protein
MIWLAAMLFVALMIAVHRINALDGGEDYGSNIGFYWPWTPIAQFCFFGFIFCILGAA